MDIGTGIVLLGLSLIASTTWIYAGLYSLHDGKTDRGLALVRLNAGVFSCAVLAITAVMLLLTLKH